MSIVSYLAGGISERMMTPKRASMAASIGSVLTRFPVASAKRQAPTFAGTSLQRVDLDRWQSGFAQGHFQRPVITPGRLEDDARGPVWCDPGDQLGVTFALVRELAGNSLGMDMDIEVLFRDIDANGDFVRRLCY